ncbi:hypothetical protein [Streptomyces sp. T028]|uniref:hypothetical protein n=1 Tax=Streptomyces sp. T028 TaxID=3394379 RepID=UPI003A87D9EC
MTHNGGPRAALVDGTLACLLAPGPLEAVRARDALSGRADRRTLIALANRTYLALTRDMPDPFATRVPLNLGDCHLEWGAATARRSLEEVVRRSPRRWAAEAVLGLGRLLCLPDLPRATLYAVVVHAFGGRPDGERRIVYDAVAALLRAGSADVGIAVVEAHETVLLSDEVDALLTRVAVNDADNESERPLADLAWLTRLTLRTCRVLGTAESRNPRPAIAALQELSDGTDASGLRDLLRRFPGLLSPVAAEFVAAHSPYVDPPGSLDAARRLLEAGRAPGVDGVLDAAWDQGLLLPASLRTLLTEASALGEPDDEASARRVLQAWARIMDHPALRGRRAPSCVLQEHATAQLLCHRTGFAPGALVMAIDGLRDMVAAEPGDTPGLSGSRRFFAEALIDRYQSGGADADLREARTLLDRPTAPARTSDELPFTHELLLCKLLLLWHERFDAPDDLERVVRVAGQVAERLARRPRDAMRQRWAAAIGQALGKYADDDDYLARVHDDRVNLANSYLAGALAKLFRRTGRLDHLDRLVDLDRRTVHGRYGSARRHAMHRANLGTTLLERFAVTRDAADLDEAITELRQAIPLIPLPHAPRAQSMLANALSTRAGGTGNTSDMAEALDWGTRSVDGTSPDHFEYANRNNNLGKLHLHQWVLSGDPAELDRAIGRMETAVRYSAPTARGRDWRVLNLAVALTHRYDVRHRHRDFLRSHRFFSRVASATAEAYPELALRGLSFWGARLARQRLWPQAAHAYARALRAEERLFRTQAVRDHKETWLTHSKGLASEAAHALERNGDRTDAVLALERGRARLLSESLGMDRVRVALLRERHEGLHARYVAAVRRLGLLQRHETG